MTTPVYVVDTAVISWMDKSGLHIGVYCSSQSETTEWCNDLGTSGWVNGSFTSH